MSGGSRYRCGIQDPLQHGAEATAQMMAIERKILPQAELAKACERSYRVLLANWKNGYIFGDAECVFAPAWRDHV